MKEILIIIIFLLFSLHPIIGETEDTIKIAAGLTVEPYIIESKDAGLEADIVREIFTLEGYKTQFVYQPLQRTKVSFKNGTVDGVMTIKMNYPEIQNTFISEEYITYYNFAVTLQSKKFQIGSIADLKNKKIDAFQQAKFALGRNFQIMAENNPDYQEIANQRNQIAKLFGNRSEVIIIDKLIFKYHHQQLKSFSDELTKNVPLDEPVIFHNLFEPSRYRMAFKTKKLMDSFNKGLKKLQASGRYQQIIASYLKE